MAEKKISQFKLNPFQAEVYFADPKEYREILVSAGEQGGKTSVSSFKSRREFDRWTGKRVSWIVGVPTYKVSAQSTKTYYRMLYPDHLGHRFNGKDDVIQLRDGRMLWFRSGTDVDSAIGIPDVVGGHIDELGKCSKEFYENIRNRSSRHLGLTIGSTTPYGMTFEKRHIVDRVCKAPDAEHWENEFGECWKSKKEAILYVRFSIRANPSYPKEEYDRLKEKMSRTRFQMRVEGRYLRPEGLIFSDLDELNWMEPVSLREPVYIGGVDWGFDHPFALSIRAICNGKAYGVSFFKKPGMSVSQQLDLIKQKTEMFHVKHWACGHDRPEMIDELKKMKIHAFKYFEYKPEYREVDTGNAKHAEILRTKQYRIFNNAPQKEDLRDEYETYSWNKDSEEDVGRSRPIDKNNDLMSAERYCTIGSLDLMKPEIEKLKLPLGYWEQRDTWTPTKRSSVDID